MPLACHVHASHVSTCRLSGGCHMLLQPNRTQPPPPHPPQGDRLYSELFNELYQFNLDNRRWFPVALRPPKKSKAEQEAAAAAEQAQQGQEQQAEQQATSNGGSSSAAAGGTADQQQQQQGSELPPGVRPELHAMLQRMLAEKGGALHAAAARIQANYRGYRVRQVRRGKR